MVGFGISVGDFIAGLKLIGTIIDALKQSGKSTTSFQHLIEELTALDAALQNVLSLELSDDLQTKKDGLGEAVKKCFSAVKAFEHKLEPYKKHLQAPDAHWSVRDSWARIKWAVSEKEDVALFRAEIRGHTSSLTILLLTVQLEAFRLESDAGEKQRQILLSTLQKLSSQLDLNSQAAQQRDSVRESETIHLRDLLQNLGSEVECLRRETKAQEEAQKTLGSRFTAVGVQIMNMLTTVSRAAAVSIRQGKLLLEASVTVVETNFRIFAMVQQIQSIILRIPAQVMRQQPVYFIDPFNRISPFHLEFVRSAEAFLAVMEINFRKAGCSSRLLKERKFVVEDTGTDSVIDIFQVQWEHCFSPGQRAAMSMVFEDRNPAQSSKVCPRCRVSHANALGEEVECDRCGILYRCVEVEETTTPSPFNAMFSQPDFQLGRSNATKKSRVPISMIVDDADASIQTTKFRRLRVASIKRDQRNRSFIMAEAEANSTPTAFQRASNSRITISSLIHDNDAPDSHRLYPGIPEWRSFALYPRPEERLVASRVTTSDPSARDFMNSISDVAVFAWALVGINGNLAEYAMKQGGQDVAMCDDDGGFGNLPVSPRVKETTEDAMMVDVPE